MHSGLLHSLKFLHCVIHDIIYLTTEDTEIYTEGTEIFILCALCVFFPQHSLWLNIECFNIYPVTNCLVLHPIEKLYTIILINEAG